MISTTPSRAKTTKKKESLEQQLKSEWERVSRLKKRNEALNQEMGAFIQEVNLQIEDAEKKMADAVYSQTAHLTTFLQRKSLAQWQKMELLAWIDQNLMSLMSSPFSDKQAVQSLIEELHVIAEGFFSNESAKEKPSSEKSGNAEQGDGRRKSKQHKEQTPNEDMFADLFKEFADDDEDDVEMDDGPGENPDSFWEQIFDDFEAFEQEEQSREDQKNKELKNLLNKTSVKAIFRRLAKVLHPDREQDEERKLVLHEQMSELIEARNNNDVFQLLSLYETHTGESPLAAIGDNKQEILTLLKSQVQQLKEEETRIIYDDPTTAHYYEHFYAKTQKTRTQKIKRYCSDLKKMTSQEMKITQSIRSISTLKPYLEERYDNRIFIDNFDFME